MEINFVILCSILGFLICSNIVLLVLYFQLRVLNKNIIETNKDYVDALSNVMNFLVSQFNLSFENSKKQQEWLEINISKVAEIDTENSQKIYDAIYQNQIFLNRLGEFLGYRPRSNIGE